MLSISDAPEIALENVLDELDIDLQNEADDSDWVSTSLDTLTHRLATHAIPIREGLVPNVVGMGAKDAVFLMEQAGLQVSLTGIGRVTRQSLNPGQRISRGQTVLLTLK